MSNRIQTVKGLGKEDAVFELMEGEELVAIFSRNEGGNLERLITEPNFSFKCYPWPKGSFRLTFEAKTKFVDEDGIPTVKYRNTGKSWWVGRLRENESFIGGRVVIQLDNPGNILVRCIDGNSRIGLPNDEVLSPDEVVFEV